MEPASARRAYAWTRKRQSSLQPKPRKGAGTLGPRHCKSIDAEKEFALLLRQVDKFLDRRKPKSAQNGRKAQRSNSLRLA